MVKTVIIHILLLFSFHGLNKKEKRKNERKIFNLDFISALIIFDQIYNKYLFVVCFFLKKTLIEVINFF
jgi:hypothetical protein